MEEIGKVRSKKKKTNYEMEDADSHAGDGVKEYEDKPTKPHFNYLMLKRPIRRRILETENTGCGEEKVKIVK